MNESFTKSEDYFENGIFWELYRDLESQFQNYFGYVPYLPRNENVYSLARVPKRFPGNPNRQKAAAK
jgi:hypothetical protein